MTTEQPRIGDADAFADLTSSGPGGPTQPAGPPADHAAGKSDESVRPLGGAGVPPPGPAPGPIQPPAAPIPGAGQPPAGPTATPGRTPRRSSPGASVIPAQAGGSMSERERAQAGLSGPDTPEPQAGGPEAPGKGRRRWFRRRKAGEGSTAGGQPAGGAAARAAARGGTGHAVGASAADLATAGPPAGTAAGQPTGTTAGHPTGVTAGQAAGTAGGEAAGTAAAHPLAARPEAAGVKTADGTTADGKAGVAPGDAPPTSDPAKPARKRKKELPTERPAGAPPDPWTAFATTSERAPGRIRRALRAVGRSFRHEYALVTYAGLLLAVALTWPTLRYPMHTVPQDVWDPARQAWQIAWAGHILLTDPAQLWHSNAFYPERYSFAFGDSLLGYAPAGMLGSGPSAAILRYNILFVLAHALLAIGAYALVRQLGAKRTGAAVAAVAFAYAPWRLAQEGHLDIVSAGGIPLALAMLARGHGWSLRYGLRASRRHAGWAAAGWLVATWQISLGFSLGLPFGYVLAGILLVIVIGVPIRKWRRPSHDAVLGWRLIVTDTLGVLILAGVTALIALPYFRAPASGPSTAEIDFFSPPLHGLLIGPAESRVWGAAHAVPRSSLSWPAEMTLLPGFVLYALALVGLVFSVWTLRQRLFLTLALAAAVVLTLGTSFFDGRWTYLPLFGHLPGSFGVRIPGRTMLWVTLLLAVLAAGAVTELVRRAEQMSAQRMPPWPGPWLRLATFVPLMLVLAETWNATAHPLVPAQPTAMRTVTSPTLVLPTAALGDQLVMLWSTSRFQPIANGAGGFAATQQAELRRTVAAFPDAASVAYLREAGIETVLVLRSQVAGTPWERSGDVPVDALGIRREDLDDNTVLFRLN